VSLGSDAHAENVGDENDETRGMAAEDGPGGHLSRQEGQAEQADEQRALGQVGDRGGGVLQVGPAVIDVGNGEEGRLYGDATDGVAQRQIGKTLRRGGNRGDETGERRTGAEQHAAGNRLAQAGAVGQAVRDLRHKGAGGRNYRCRQTECRQGHPQRLCDEIHLLPCPLSCS